MSAGQAPVEHVASNRRILGSDGKVVFVRYTKCRDSQYCDAPEGVIDPMMTSIGFWDGSDRIATLNYYATHPMSHYGDGAVSADFPGIARRAQAGFSVYFTGAAGNIGAGKYNNGAPEVRQTLADRLADAMRRARAAEQKHAIDALGWTTVPVRLPHREGREFSEEAIVSELKDTTREPNPRQCGPLSGMAPVGQAWPHPCCRVPSCGSCPCPPCSWRAIRRISTCRAKERGNDVVAMAAYGDYGPCTSGQLKHTTRAGTKPVRFLACHHRQKRFSSKRSERR